MDRTRFSYLNYHHVSTFVFIQDVASVAVIVSSILSLVSMYNISYLVNTLKNKAVKFILKILLVNQPFLLLFFFKRRLIDICRNFWPSFPSRHMIWRGARFLVSVSVLGLCKRKFCDDSNNRMVWNIKNSIDLKISDWTIVILPIYSRNWPRFSGTFVQRKKDVIRNL